MRHYNINILLHTCFVKLQLNFGGQSSLTQEKSVVLYSGGTGFTSHPNQQYRCSYFSLFHVVSPGEYQDNISKLYDTLYSPTQDIMYIVLL